MSASAYLMTSWEQQSHTASQTQWLMKLTQSLMFFPSDCPQGHELIMSLARVQVLQVMNIPGFLWLIKTTNVEPVNAKGPLSHERESGEHCEVKQTC